MPEVEEGESCQEIVPTLRILAGLVEHSIGEGSICVTLTLGGMAIAGELIGEREYWRLLSEQFRTAETPGEKERATSETISKIIEAAVSMMPDGERELDEPVRYVHLKNAVILHPEGAYSRGGGLLWIGRANAVTGIAMGVPEEAYRGAWEEE